MTRRPVVRYFGGKAALAPWIIDHMPPHRVYVEPFGGGAAVLLQKPRSIAEVYNDLEGDLVNLFRVLRNPRAGKRLVRLVALTPYAREEFLAAYEPTGEAVERARRLLVRSHMGHGGEAANGRRTGFRYIAHRKELRGTHPATDWARLPVALAEIVVRCQGLIVERCDALQVLRRYDGIDTLHSVDPPYLKELRARGSKHLYAHDLDESDHVRLAEVLKGLDGAVLLSGYSSPLYDELYAGWHQEERWSIVAGGGRRREILWMNRCPPSTRLFQEGLLGVIDRSLYPIVAFDLIENDSADKALESSRHWLGGCNRPFGRQSWGLHGELVGVAVSASTVNASCGGYRRGEVVELARLCAHPSHRDMTRAVLRLWRKVAPAGLGGGVLAR